MRCSCEVCSHNRLKFACIEPVTHSDRVRRMALSALRVDDRPLKDATPPLPFPGDAGCRLSNHHLSRLADDRTGAAPIPFRVGRWRNRMLRWHRTCSVCVASFGIASAEQTMRMLIALCYIMTCALQSGVWPLISCYEDMRYTIWTTMEKQSRSQINGHATMGFKPSVSAFIGYFSLTVGLISTKHWHNKF